MVQTPRKKLPKEVVDMDDKKIMKTIFGEKVMKEVDKLVSKLKV